MRGQRPQRHRPGRAGRRDVEQCVGQADGQSGQGDQAGIRAGARGAAFGPGGDQRIGDRVPDHRDQIDQPGERRGEAENVGIGIEQEQGAAVPDQQEAGIAEPVAGEGMEGW